MCIYRVIFSLFFLTWSCFLNFFLLWPESLAPLIFIQVSGSCPLLANDFCYRPWREGRKQIRFLTILRTDLDKRQLYNEAEETRIGNLVVPYPPPHPEGEKMLMARAIFSLSKDVKCCRNCLHLIPISKRSFAFSQLGPKPNCTIEEKKWMTLDICQKTFVRFVYGSLLDKVQILVLHLVISLIPRHQNRFFPASSPTSHLCSDVILTQLEFCLSSVGISGHERILTITKVLGQSWQIIRHNDRLLHFFTFAYTRPSNSSPPCCCDSCPLPLLNGVCFYNMGLCIIIFQIGWSWAFFSFKKLRYFLTYSAIIWNIVEASLSISIDFLSL